METKMKISIIAGGGMGGTEKAAHLYAWELARRGHEVEVITDPSSYRAVILNAAGVKIKSIELNYQGFISYLSEFKPDILHNHTSGYSDHTELYSALRNLGIEKPKLVETNVFGQLLDLSDHDDVKMRMFVSYTSGMQAFQKIRKRNDPPNFHRETVLFNPLPADAFLNNPAKGLAFRAKLGLTQDEILIIRIGRPGPKWETWECLAFQKARRSNSMLRLFLMEPETSLRKAIEAGKYGEGIIIHEATADPRYLEAVYSAGNLMLQASSFGESFGYTLAEAMAAGMPIITLSTPWGDQAQTELVKHGETGYVCRTIQGMALALAELSQNREKLKAFGAAGTKRIRSMASVEQEVVLLEEIFEHLVHEKTSLLMEQRYNDWQHFVKARKEKDHIPCYEMDHQLRWPLILSSIYDAYRQCKHFIRYVLMKLRGLPVYPPKWS